LRKNLRKEIIRIVGYNPTTEDIYRKCLSYGWVDRKSKEIAETIEAYLHNTTSEVALNLNIDERTVIKRIHTFLEG
jgi:hypothetical protein